MMPQSGLVERYADVVVSAHDPRTGDIQELIRLHPQELHPRP